MTYILSQDNPIHPIITAELHYDKQNSCYNCLGSWSICHLNEINLDLKQIEAKSAKTFISGKKLTYFDSAGALFLDNFVQKLQKKSKEVEFIDFTPEQLKLLELIKSQEVKIHDKITIPAPKDILYRLGEETVHKVDQVSGFLDLVGDLVSQLVEACYKWRQFRFSSILSNVDTAGLKALPIIALLAFLIGVVLAYQMGLQLQTYGADSFIAYISGMAIFREFAPLMTAIIVAGRTSSSFTAQLGSMKISEEIDALHTMGLSTTELLVMPKVLAMLLVFPLLIFWADLFSILGAMVMSKFMLKVSYMEYLARLKASVGLKQLLLGLYKAPVFALIVSLVGCFQGFAVESNTESIGSQTTKSVVQALFLIIIADAVFSVIYNWLRL